MNVIMTVRAIAATSAAGGLSSERRAEARRSILFRAPATRLEDDRGVESAEEALALALMTCDETNVVECVLQWRAELTRSPLRCRVRVRCRSGDVSILLLLGILGLFGRVL